MASAAARNVPIVSARQMLTWLDGRDASTFTNVAYSAGTLNFDVTAGTGATGLTGMVPTASADGLLSSLTRNGSPVTYTTQTIKGLEYAFFTAAAGTYAARYGTAAAAGPAITAAQRRDHGGGHAGAHLGHQSTGDDGDQLEQGDRRARPEARHRRSGPQAPARASAARGRRHVPLPGALA